MKKKIFVFINAGKGTGWITGMAMCEDGTLLASHVSSHEVWFEHDMGLTSSWQHDLYAAHCPNGYELVYIDDVLNHPEFMAAYKLNQEQAKEQNEPSKTT